MAANGAGGGGGADSLKKGSSSGGFYPNLASDAVKCREFLVNFTDDMMTNGKPYLRQLQSIADRHQSTLNIAVDDLKRVSAATRRAGCRAKQRQRRETRHRKAQPIRPLTLTLPVPCSWSFDWFGFCVAVSSAMRISSSLFCTTLSATSICFTPRPTI